MGGGPVSWAVEAHRRAGLRVLATPDAARTFNDDLELVQRELGIEIIPDEAAAKLIGCRDYRARRIPRLRLRGHPRRRLPRSAWRCGRMPLALAVFDHGAAPPEISDRQFRMDYLAGAAAA